MVMVTVYTDEGSRGVAVRRRIRLAAKEIIILSDSRIYRNKRLLVVFIYVPIPHIGVYVVRV